MMKCMQLFLYLLCYPLFCTAAYKIHLSSAWYPDKKSQLSKALEECDQYAKQYYDAELNPSKIRAVIVPHAGLQYSGAVATAAYRLLPFHFFKRIIVLGPSHHESFQGIGLPHKKYDAYKNILGQLSLDTQMLNELSHNEALFSDQWHAHELDHSINMQVLFIQRYCGTECRLVPLLVGDITVKQAEKIAAVLSQYIDESTLVVVSSDFTHYGPRFSYEPFKHEQNVSAHIRQLDSSVVRQIQDINLDGFEDVLHKTGATVCGCNPIKILLAMIQQKTFGAIDSYVVGYDTSDSVMENPEHSVSYVSCVFSNERKEQKDRLTGYEKELLLTIARDRLDEVCNDGPDLKKMEFAPGLLTKSLQEIHGVFVTLYKIGKNGYKQLRGCIGHILGTKPLFEEVYDVTALAALHDSRFDPVAKHELPYVDISISVLSNPEKIASYRDIVIGKDGVILHNHGHSALYLPHVAVEQGWDVQQMLESLCQKAGLPATAWKHKDTTYQIFTSNDFAEDKDPLEIMYEGYKKNDE